VRISLDGKDLGEYGPALQRLDLPPGEHVIEFSNPACYPKQVVVPAGHAPDKIPARLKWKPATLTVQTKAPGAEVLVDGRIAAKPGQPVALPIAEQSPDGRRTLTVRVMAPGRDSVEQTTTVRANEAHTLDIDVPGAP
jgi:hypothetical protein